MADAVSSSKTKALTFYAIAWVMVLAAGATGLTALRLWGWDQIERKHAREEFALARETFDRGDVIRAQKTLVRLLLARPERLAGALTEFDTDMLGMPAVAAVVSTTPERLKLSSTAQLRQILILEGIDAAIEKLNSISVKENVDRDVALWHARLLLKAGNFDGANNQFDEYWAGYADERREVLEQLTPAAGELKQRGAGAADQLFALGLRDEAAEIAERALAAGAEEPNLIFLVAVKTEREGGRMEAIARYKRVLKALPNHDLAIRRIQVLSQQDW